MNDAQERRYRIKEYARRAMTELRDLEDYARLELHDDLLAERVRGVHLALTEDVLHGKTYKLSAWERARLWDRYCALRGHDPHAGARVRSSFLRRLLELANRRPASSEGAA